MLNIPTQAQEQALANVRSLTTSDMPAVLEIETGSCTFPWLEKNFRDALPIENVTGAVAEREGKVVGYMIYEIHGSGIDLFKLAVAKDVRGTGIGRALIADLAAKLDGERRRSITAVVNERNLDAQLWLKTLKFEATDILRGHFDDRHDDLPEDGYSFKYVVPPNPGNRRINGSEDD